MRAGWIVSIIGHIGVVLMTLLVWETRSTLMPEESVIVPVEIVDVAAESNVRALAEDVPVEDDVPEAEAETQEAEAAPAPSPDPRSGVSSARTSSISPPSPAWSTSSAIPASSATMARAPTATSRGLG
ncbi:MAG: hypothetical protein R3C16_04185 [Hyphomonadaceae bacterium]